MGDIEEGWEWFAFTFNDQEQLELSAQEIENMISASEEMTKTAYSRMLLNSNHRWLGHTDCEADFIVDHCDLNAGDYVLDVGCGIGRHAIALAKHGMHVTGIDYVPELNTVNFITEDSRNLNLDKQYNAVLCLYDVLGSFVDNSDNIKILENIAKSLRPNGKALISVMNYELTKDIAKNVFSISDEPNRLLDLPPAKIMEKTGNVFDPDYYLVDEFTHIVYRKEQFVEGRELPVELIIRDRRFERREIEDMCISVGLTVDWSRFVRSGKWTEPLEAKDSGAKEILLLCTKN